MGTWFAKSFLRDGDAVLLFGRDADRLQVIRGQMKVEISTDPGSLGDADVVLLSVPMDSFEDVVRRCAPHIGPDQAVVEITSVKVMPVEAMHRHLKTRKVLGVHPMFGPGARDMTGQNFILTPTNETEAKLAEKARVYLEKRGGRVRLMTPPQHDETMATVLGLPHVLALVAADCLLALGDFQSLETLGGTSCKLLLTLADSVLSEDPELYASLQMNLQGVGGIHKLLAEKLADWADIVGRRDRTAFVCRMEALRKQREQSGPDFRQAYEKMYRILDSNTPDRLPRFET
jgi:prephenate dehydrogenase